MSYIKGELPEGFFRLEVGAGERQMDGYVHNDARDLDGIDIVSDCRGELYDLLGPSRVIEVRANHILEHFPFSESVYTLQLWQSLIVPGGKIHIEVPNMYWQAWAFANHQITADEYVEYVYGEQTYEGNFHFNGYSEDRLFQHLEEAGFTNVSIINIGQVLVATGVK